MDADVLQDLDELEPVVKPDQGHTAVLAPSALNTRRLPLHAAALVCRPACCACSSSVALHAASLLEGQGIEGGTEQRVFFSGCS